MMAHRLDDQYAANEADARESERAASEDEDTVEFDLAEMEREARITTEAREQREREARQVRECHEIGGPETW